ncbi:hypothetical protein FRB94_000712 [Tulasnella sp. JGI-2019a]|nr:hypothetical protein FRB94_000712 [Tulasnella sp. JGI-2019a]
MHLHSAGGLPPSQTISPTHAHHAFYSTAYEAARIPELLLRYFMHFNRSELAKSAIVCRSWSTLALDTLWRHHEVPLSVLLSQLPFLYERPFKRRGSGHDANDENEDDPDSHSNHGGWYPIKEQASHETIDTSKWNLYLNKFAHKITRLFWNSALRGPSIRLLSTLLDKSAGLVLCPNLRSLRIVIAPYSERLHAMAIPMLCGSSVETVEMQHLLWNGNNSVNVAGHFGIALKTCGSRIRRLILCPPNIRYYYLTPDFSLFSHLTEVHLTEPECEPGGRQIFGDPAKSINFSSLQKLTISSGYLVNCVLLESNMPALESLVVSTLAEDKNGAISMQLSRRSGLLREMEFHSIKFHEGVGSMIRALSSLCHLRKLKLGGGTSKWDITDSDMNVLARSVPNLQSISITLEQTLIYEKVQIPLTHATLLSVVQHCRQLNEIELPMDLSGVDGSKEKPVGFMPSATVTSLKFCKVTLPSKYNNSSRTSQVECVDRIVHFLVGCCPEVQVLEAHQQSRSGGRSGISVPKASARSRCMITARRVLPGAEAEAGCLSEGESGAESESGADSETEAGLCLEERFRKHLEDKWRVISTCIGWM